MLLTLFPSLKKSTGGDAIKIVLDETWKEVLNLLRGYEIEEATLERNEDALTLEEMDDSHVVLVRAELRGPITGDAEPGRLGVSVESLFWILESCGAPYRAEMQVGNSEINVSPLDDEHSHEVTLSVKEPAREELPELDVEHTIEAENVDMWTPLRAAKRIFGVKNFRPEMATEDGRLFLEYGSEDTVDGLRAELGEAKVDADASSTFNPALLEPLKGEWNVRLATNLPLRAEKVIGGDEEGWKAEVTVVVAPKVEDVGGK